ncbi:hypothetical protein SO802_014658 [Lithocarpus litseifolius]|uniref:DUF4283 domain-containing protein n=1 Tax=Lithocarpus litseifolius TaxID=425828 RepID=A0AAW2CRK0_9ROSI
MEDLTKSWGCLTLSDVEGSNLKITEDEAVTEHVLATKFLTKRALNIEAIAKTFSPIWRAKNGFKIRKEGDHVVLFTFDNKTEIDKVLAAEPWSFDKHLMVFQRYDKDIDIVNMEFNMVTFWIQVHDIPGRFKTRAVAEKICGILGTVTKPTGDMDVEGDGFIRVRVTVDISKPLCRGRVISLKNGKELWVSFKYERLSNLCYWCGSLMHDDRDCELWLESEVPGFFSNRQGGSRSTATASTSRTSKPPSVVVRKTGPSPEIMRPEKEGAVSTPETVIAPNVQE